MLDDQIKSKSQDEDQNIITGITNKVLLITQCLKITKCLIYFKLKNTNLHTIFIPNSYSLDEGAYSLDEGEFVCKHIHNNQFY